jgi:hypothetical protein
MLRASVPHSKVQRYGMKCRAYYTYNMVSVVFPNGLIPNSHSFHPLLANGEINMWGAGINENVRLPSHPTSRSSPHPIPTCPHPVRPIVLISSISTKRKLIGRTLFSCCAPKFSVICSIFACFLACLSVLPQERSSIPGDNR